jgi:flagella basal body P-ring formation protein FlgA
MRRLLAMLACSLVALAPAAATSADAEPIRRAIDDFLQRQAAGLPCPASHEIGRLATDALPSGCRRVKVGFPTGAKPWGRTHVQAACADGASWSLYVPVLIRVSADYVASARPLRAGQAISAADVELRRGDLAELPHNVLTELAAAIGQVPTAALPAERPLRADLLKKPLLVRQGQAVRVVSAGAGFQVAGEGKAMGNAVAGQVVQVRMPSGAVVSGVAQGDGSIRVGQ